MLSTDLPAEATSEELRLLVPHLPGTRNLIIEGQLRVAFKIACWYARRYGRDHEDIAQAAFLGLTQAVDRACKGSLRDDNIAAYCAVTIHGACRHWIDGDHLVPVDPRAIKQYYDTIGRPTTVEMWAAEKAVDMDPGEQLIWSDILDIFTPDEQTVIQMKISGYNQCETAAKIGVNQSTVARLLAGVRLKTERMNTSSAWLLRFLRIES